MNGARSGGTVICAVRSGCLNSARGRLSESAIAISLGARLGFAFAMRTLGLPCSDTHFRFPVSFVEAALINALSNYESDQGTELLARAEIEWIETNAAGVGPATLRRTSRTFFLQLVRDIVP